MFKKSHHGYKERWLIALVFTVLFLLYRKKAGEYFINKGFVEVGVIYLCFFCSYYFFWFFRYWMPQVTCDGFSGSVGSEPIPAGKYYVFRCGEVYEPFHLEGKLHTLVIPKACIKKVGDNWVSYLRAYKLPFIEMPEEVHNVMYNQQDKFNLENIYLAEYTAEFIQSNTNPLDLEQDLPSFKEEVNVLNRRINIRTRALEGDNDMLQETMETARALGKESGWRKFIPTFKKKEDEE